MRGGSSHVHSPVARAGDGGFAPLLIGLVGALHVVGDDIGARRELFRRGLGEEPMLAQLVIEAFLDEIALLVGDPLLKAPMRMHDELGHSNLPIDRAGFALSPAINDLCLSR